MHASTDASKIPDKWIGAEVRAKINCGPRSLGYVLFGDVVEFIRQRSRTYLFSNALPPPIVCAALKALELIAAGSDLRDRLHANARRMRAGLEQTGFQLRPGQHPIMPVMLGDAALASRMADRLLERGIYVIGFSYPVVPQGQARIRIQMSAAHTDEQIDRAIAAFTAVGTELGVIGKR